MSSKAHLGIPVMVDEDIRRFDVRVHYWRGGHVQVEQATRRITGLRTKAGHRGGSTSLSVPMHSC